MYAEEEQTRQAIIDELREEVRQLEDDAAKWQEEYYKLYERFIAAVGK